jgi:hypothetical protein
LALALVRHDAADYGNNSRGDEGRISLIDAPHDQSRGATDRQRTARYFELRVGIVLGGV